MKKLLIFLFVVYGSELKTSYLNPRIESMGSTGMIFGKEYGALHSFPTAHTSIKKYITGGINLDLYLEQLTEEFLKDAMVNSFLFGRIGKFGFGFGLNCIINYKDYKLYLEEFISISFAKKLKELNICLGLKLIRIDSFDINIDNTKNTKNTNFSSYISPSIGVSYEKSIGNFAISLSDIKNSSGNLKLGYGKEFKMHILSLRNALEIHDLLNLLMQNDKRDYAMLRNIHFGSELSMNIKDTIIIDGRFGLKNFFPTYGFSLNIANVLIIEFAISNTDLGKKLGEDRKKTFSGSFRLGYFE